MDDVTTRFFDAIRQGDAAQVRSLLSAHPHLSHSETADGASAALWAIYTGHADLAELVLAGREPDFLKLVPSG
ncbi:MAG TPA: hypothetical protein VKV17_22005 [Bryobacteraceae bacterium]|nr:hypothetical protein [Bryobacteraceae bacterium]